MKHVLFSSYSWFLWTVPQGNPQPWATDSFSHQLPRQYPLRTAASVHWAPTLWGCNVLTGVLCGIREEEPLIVSGINQQ